MNGKGDSKVNVARDTVDTLLLFIGRLLDLYKSRVVQCQLIIYLVCAVKINTYDYCTFNSRSIHSKKYDV